jgi:hypothetical protein
MTPEQQIFRLEQQMADLIARVEALEFPLYKCINTPLATLAPEVTNWHFSKPVIAKEASWPFPPGARP